MRDVLVSDVYNLHDWVNFGNYDIVGAGSDMAVTLDSGNYESTCIYTMWKMRLALLFMTHSFDIKC